jgi:molybdate transport system ATP-binding protein
MDTLHVDLAVPLRSFALELTLAAGPGTLAVAGPSGAGKSTLLRALAGLVRPARGRIALGGEVWFDSERRLDVPPERRAVGFVFQDYALFPHLTVEENVAYGASVDVRALLRRFGVADLASARPGDLSGGERQRVALARALAREPRLLLLDEPMAALDPHTRAHVRGELRALLRELGLPAVLVTHDFEDAAALADSVAVLVAGRVVQEGRPEELVAAPADPFVATLTGGNLLPGVARRGSGELTEVTLDGGGILYSTDEGVGRVGVAVATWDVTVGHEAPSDSALNHVAAPVASLVRLGNRVRVRVGPLTAEVTAASVERLGLEEGEPVVASFKATATRLVPFD